MGLKRLGAVLLGMATAAAPAQEAAFDLGPVLTVHEENDLVVRTDRHYTQGIKVSYLHSDDALPGFVRSFADWLPSLGYDHRVSRLGLQIGQNIYTPEDTQVTEPQSNDRPYAGWLYLGLALHRRGMTAGTFPALESFELQLGVIGPESLAEDAQTWIHEIRDFDTPKGWDNQLNTEFGFAARYWRGARLTASRASARYVDFIPHVAGSLGNVETALRFGTTLRAGYNLPDNFGSQTISSLVSQDGGRSRTLASRKFGIHAFTGAEGWLIGYTAFLDGTLFRGSPEVKRDLWAVEWKSGVALAYGHVEASFAYVFRSREFRSQEEENSYGALAVKWNF